MAAFLGELFYFFGRAIEAMDNPDLLRMVFLVQVREQLGSSHVMDDQRFVILFRKEDVLLERLLLPLKAVFV